MINSKYSSVTFSGGIYSYKLGDADINVKLTEGKKNFKTRYCNIDQAEFKITREIDGKECYEEGVVKFSDYNATQVKTPNEIHLNSFCLDYVINSPTKTTYNSADHHAGEIFSLEKYLYYNYMEENDYSIISIRPGVIYFGGQMSTDILELPYTVRKEGKDFYLDVESNVISDIKCSPNSESQVRYGIDIDGNDPYIRPISDYTGKGLRDLNGSLSFKVNGAEYNAHVSREISLVFDAAGTHTDNQKPLCMFYTPQIELNDSNGTSPLGSPFNHIYRTNKNTFAIVLDTSDGTNGYYDIVPVISDLNNSKYYGKAFFVTSIIVANTENIPTDADKFFTATVGGENKTFSFAMVENADGIPYIELRNYSDFEPAQIDLSFVKAEGKVKYYTVSAE